MANNYSNIDPKASDAEVLHQIQTDLERKSTKQFLTTNNFPTEIIDLPSKGLAYSENSPLRTGKIEMKYMTAKEEDILSSANLIKQAVVIDKLLESLIVTDVDYKELIAGDRNALVIAARVLSYGKDYKVSDITCPACSKVQPYTVDLLTLEHKPLTDVFLNCKSGEFEVNLPMTGIPITLKLLNGHDDTAVREELGKLKDTEIDRSPSLKLKRAIIKVDGDSSKEVIAKYVDTSLFGQDSLFIKQFLAKNTPDLDRTVHFTCNNIGKCEYKETSILQIGTNFFWPGV
jgi:hypothetical protein